MPTAANYADATALTARGIIPGKQLHSIASTAEQLSLCISTVRAEIAGGKLQAVKCRRRTLVTDESLRAYVASLRRAELAAA